MKEEDYIKLTYISGFIAGAMASAAVSLILCFTIL